MLFNSWVFIGVFLPITLIVYRLALRFGWRRAAVVFLTGASLFFYGYWDVRFLPLLLLSILVNYAIVMIMTDQAGWSRKLLFAAGLGFNLGLLFFFKYALFAQSVVAEFTGVQLGMSGIILPLGISFYTFTQIAYLCDAYWRAAFERNLPNYFLFVTFFPHLIAGPILHHQEVMPQFSRKENTPLASDLAIGITIFIFGLAKKVILADSLALVAKPVFDGAAEGVTPDLLSAWAGVLAYTLQIYFDFSGYSDMAIGLSKMLGIRLPINFAAPYRATSIVEFWRRWHITLSRFLRDYLYVPLGGNRVHPARRYLNVFITMFLGGVWHGAGWTFVLWGTLHGGMIIINQLWQRMWRGPPMPAAAGWAITFFAVMMAWVPFRAHDLLAAGRVYAGLCGGGGLPAGLNLAGISDFVRRALIEAAGLGGDGNMSALAALVAIPAALFIALAVPNVQRIMGPVFPGLASPGYPDHAVPALVRPLDIPAWRPSLRWSLAIGILAAISLLKLNDVTEFLYFQF
jgi:alginate O-acetyltransferase complex protein AlgI